MPKEIIHDDALLPDKDNSTPYAIEIGWGRDTHVQMGTIDLQAEQYSPAAGWFVTLDRNMVNRVIRVLRRARDQAFGADE